MSYEFKSTSYEFKSTSYEFESTSYQFESTFDYKKAQRKGKKVEYSKVSHPKKPGREKALSFAVGISIIPPNCSFMPESYFNLLFCT